MAKKKKGQRWKCGECGLVVVIDEPCECVSCELVCCDVQMEELKPAKKHKLSEIGDAEGPIEESIALQGSERT